MPSYHVVAESGHELQNPTSPEKIRLLGAGMRLDSGSSVLDLASGRGGPAILLADTFGCRITCVEKADEFDEAARRRAHEKGLGRLIEFVHADAGDFLADARDYNAAMCLGASFVWGGLPGTLAALVPAVQDARWIAVGEPYWRTWPLPDRAEPDEGEDYLPLRDTMERFREAGLEVVTLVDASLDDWDRYESLHWLAAEEWLTKHAHEPDAEEIRILTQRFRDRYLRWQRELLGWAIIVGRKR